MTFAPETSRDLFARIARLARSERGSLCALARAEGLPPEDAVDCVQEGLCTLLNAMQSGRPLPEGIEGDGDRAWAAYLATIVRNAARNGRRRHFRARPHDELLAHEAPAAGPPEDPAADEALARAEDHVRLRACVAELCEVQQAVVTLRMLEEHAGEDVARALGITPGHVAVLLHRAKAALRTCMLA